MTGENKIIKEVNEIGKENYTNLFRKNPWVLSTIVLAIVVLVLLVNVLGISGNNLSKDVAGKNLLDYYIASGASGLTFVNISEVSGVYQVNFDYKGAVVPMYITKDGKLAGSLNLIVPVLDSGPTTPPPQDIPKSDKPVVELYVFTYCPYGLQMEKAMIPVAKLLGSKIDFKIRQIGAMHGEFEKIEAQRQLCIQKEYPAKVLDYMLAFAGDLTCTVNQGTSTSPYYAFNGDVNCLTGKITSLFSKLGINANTISSCMPSTGLSLYNAEVSNAGAKGFGGSPTITINGVEAQLSRSPDAVKTAICAAFNTVPSQCSQNLSTEQASPGFGASAGSGSATSAQC